MHRLLLNSAVFSSLHKAAKFNNKHAHLRFKTLQAPTGNAKMEKANHAGYNDRPTKKDSDNFAAVRASSSPRGEQYQATLEVNLIRHVKFELYLR